MKLLAREIGRIICAEIGPGAFMDRLTDPFWFQAFGCALGFDWHSSGLTTTVCGALKEGFKDISGETGIYFCGGKGATSRKTPLEIDILAEKRRIKGDPEKLKYASKMSAKVDNTALQDGYQLYHHTFVVNESGAWAVIQQGMNDDTGWARRYHWSGSRVEDFVCEPHAAVCCDHRGRALNMVAKESADVRTVCAKIARTDPDRVHREYLKIKNLDLPSRHDVRERDILPENFRKIMITTYEKNPADFEGLLGLRGVGPGTIRALALVAELVYGKEPSFKDPARFSFAHGGKDGHPYPVNRKRYDETISFLNGAVSKTRIGHNEKLRAFRRLEGYFAREESCTY